MTNTGQLLLKNWRITTLYIFFIVVCILQALIPSPDKATLAKYSISAWHERLVALSVELPYIIIWIMSLVGYLRLNTYAQVISKGKDGKAFRTISVGLLFLSLWLPLTSILNSVASEIYANHPGSTAALVITNVYIDLILLFLGFLFVYLGSAKLLPLITRIKFQASLPVILGFITFSCLYTFLVLHDPARSHTTHSVAVSTYYEPDWLIILTVVIPRLIYWFLGVQAVYNIYLYSVGVKGKLYKSALKSLAMGLSGVIGITILLRCLQSLSTELDELSLALLLILVYALLILIGLAYGFVVKGARALQKLEEN